MQPPSRLLRVSARIELLSLAVLLANLATVHQQALAALLGPLHGCAYLIAVISTATATATVGERGPAGDRTATLLALIPGIGGMLALRRLAAAPRTAHAPRAAPPGA
ncbi:DUF3817 domain-containing protein [Streptomyces sp. NPDC085929]|uniref:DUF3817 domain-containing protein n=1 Tax=Streptomyces sp. NPDC085929 TaxID=3365739 RepID=UPI0037D3EACE